MSTKTLTMYSLWCISVISLQWTLIDALVSVSSNSYTTPVSSNANLSCNVTGVTFNGWKDPDGRTLTTDTSSRMYVISTGSRHDLIIKKVQKSDKGIYRCVTSSEALPVTLHVQYGPSVILPQTTTGIQWSSYSSPDPIMLKCKFDGYPVPTIVLSKDGKVIKNVASTGSLTYAFNTKTIDEFGFYQCTAMNSLGETIHYVEVAKIGPPEPPANVTVDVGCESVRVDWIPPFSNRGSPVTSYRVELIKGGWAIDGEDLGSSQRRHVFFELDKYTSYEVRINCENSEGKGAWEKRSFKTTDFCGTAHAHAHESWYLMVVLSLVIAMTTTF